MSGLPRRKQGGYFPAMAGAPAPLVVRVKRRVQFGDVDPMGVLWHGRYAAFFEQANEELCRRFGMSYADFRREGVMAPIVQFHVDYFASAMLGEEVVTTGRMLWNESARVNIEYEMHKENGELAAAGYTVQMFVDENRTPLWAPPPMQLACRQRWLAGKWGEPN
jgi:acyl-CoA thioester hydrolase